MFGTGGASGDAGRGEGGPRGAGIVGLLREALQRGQRDRDLGTITGVGDCGEPEHHSACIAFGPAGRLVSCTAL